MLAKETRSEEEDFYPRSPCGERRNGCQADPAGQHFYPRSPCGERLVSVSMAVAESVFLSTLSLRRATQLVRYLVKPFCISIHALLAESDRVYFFFCVVYHYFYPRSPCGERLDKHCEFYRNNGISIHALLAESDSMIGAILWRRSWLFLSTLSLRRATPPAPPGQEF